MLELAADPILIKNSTSQIMHTFRIIAFEPLCFVAIVKFLILETLPRPAAPSQQRNFVAV